ncbi:cysteine-rich CWC family protein [Caballeronia sp. LZ032]|uniref:cysteine-rich CWC family protein n=1 Tax=Caballeronia sp. LZ032 TaxID=3038565 RepID=UPI00285619DF|nr:cysteine-rich CWC family protein [Caballeronia sp. LZ032]MDR5876721.1 cysteine-rich CWC family protein [Caballeronia sp. LZ032]
MAFEKTAAQTPPVTPAGAQTCAICGAALRCGVLAGDPACWCAALPALPPDRLQAGATCLCPSCLAAALERAGLPG